MSTSHDCPFWQGRTSKERHAELYAEIEAKFPRKNPKDPKAPGRSAQRKKVGFSNPDADGFIRVGATEGTGRIEPVLSGPPSPIAPDSVKPTSGSILGAIADDALRPELKGNEEARQLMQETLLDEAAFAAADAADTTTAANVADGLEDSLGSPPLEIAYV